MNDMQDSFAAHRAAELLGTAMRDTEAPVMQMAGALTRISHALGRAAAASDANPCGCAHLKRDIAICIESLQFHDRLIQQLTAVRRLMGSNPSDAEQASGFMPPEGSVELF
ncbi:MAG TPA: hypothetical protein VFS52_00375 [Steroidobacteraceae bacterium]|jgi:hypothetical protein|nr:hypothetical protein [Steroidobacteraceae bacterium]